MLPGTPSNAVCTLRVASIVRPGAGASSWTITRSVRETNARRLHVPELSVQLAVTSPVRKSVTRP
jgi:hypothetical protein